MTSQRWKHPPRPLTLKPNDDLNPLHRRSASLDLVGSLLLAVTFFPSVADNLLGKEDDGGKGTQGAQHGAGNDCFGARCQRETDSLIPLFPQGPHGDSVPLPDPVDTYSLERTSRTMLQF